MVTTTSVESVSSRSCCWQWVCSLMLQHMSSICIYVRCLSTGSAPWLYSSQVKTFDMAGCGSIHLLKVFVLSGLKHVCDVDYWFGAFTSVTSASHLSRVKKIWDLDYIPTVFLRGEGLFSQEEATGCWLRVHLNYIVTIYSLELVFNFNFRFFFLLFYLFNLVLIDFLASQCSFFSQKVGLLVSQEEFFRVIGHYII